MAIDSAANKYFGYESTTIQQAFSWPATWVTPPRAIQRRGDRWCCDLAGDRLIIHDNKAVKLTPGRPFKMNIRHLLENIRVPLRPAGGRHKRELEKELASASR